MLVLLALLIQGLRTIHLLHLGLLFTQLQRLYKAEQLPVLDEGHQELLIPLIMVLQDVVDTLKHVGEDPAVVLGLLEEGHVGESLD